MNQTEVQGSSVPKKWEGSVCATLAKSSPDHAWSFYKDFFSFHKFNPGTITCTGTSGTNGEPGCIRHCSVESDGGDLPAMWAKERLLTVDHDARLLSYEVLENNMGFELYVSTVRIVPSGEGCVIEWGFTVDPVDGWALDDLVSKIYDHYVQIMARRIEESQETS